jgi:chromosome segregation ATPase
MAASDEEKYKRSLVLAEKRHNEIKAALKAIEESFKNDNKQDEGVKNEIKGLSGKIEQFADAIKKLPAPAVKVDVNNDKMVTSVSQMCKDICAGQDEILKALNNKPVVDSFTIKKDNWGIKIIQVNYKK